MRNIVVILLAFGLACLPAVAAPIAYTATQTLAIDEHNYHEAIAEVRASLWTLPVQPRPNDVKLVCPGRVVQPWEHAGAGDDYYYYWFLDLSLEAQNLVVLSQSELTLRCVLTVRVRVEREWQRSHYPVDIVLKAAAAD